MSETLFAICLGIGAAITLAIANASVKASGDVLMSRATMSASAMLIVLPFAFIVPLPNKETWMILAISIPAHALYQTTLIRALTRGDLSLVFPIMRGGAPLITAIAAYFILQDSYTPLSIAGLILASAATIIFALPTSKMTSEDPKRRKAALIWAVACSGCIALYNVIDAQGVRAAPSPFTFIVWLFLLDAILITTATIWVRKGSYITSFKQKWRFGAVAGASAVFSFGMTLYAFSFANVTFVSALRETSVVFAAIIGWRMLKEGSGLRRLFAAIALVTGLILFQVGS
ncbi:DMT family transporter [Hirschia baltica]|uniref:EamA domain-containing protein n=1 Tax=Hirschia baltica (strain ATCC 49814 / DSM 5838 / IFAM 1418) TaxID=582402 RepID=C6XKX4_HIRBI|nr:DMT family transporter [Hirschia baltica]ACT57803.1 protein of unknown function DUF6 transmembrane [Hirschia baltica ATCC 49814]